MAKGQHHTGILRHWAPCGGSGDLFEYVWRIYARWLYRFCQVRGVEHILGFSYGFFPDHIESSWLFCRCAWPLGGEVLFKNVTPKSPRGP